MADRSPTLFRSLGQFVGHIWRGVRAKPDERRVLRHDVEHEERQTPQGSVTLRRTTIEEIEIERQGER